MGPVNILCFPFAGGNKYSFREFQKYAQPYFNISCVEYPGRGSRVNEDFVRRMDELVMLLLNEIKDFSKGGRYIFYGHSMGGIVAFFLAKKIVSENLVAPSHLFITGTSGPCSVSREKKRHLMTSHEFIEEIKSLKGCPDEVLRNPELMSYLEPILRADFEITETFSYDEACPPFDIPITVVTGSDEEIELEDVYLWQKETTQKIDFHTMPGNHFFIYEHLADLFKLFRTKIF